MDKASKRRLLPAPAVAAMDFAMFAVILLGFAYFHHVRPSVGENNPDNLKASVIPTDKNQYGSQYGNQYGSPSVSTDESSGTTRYVPGTTTSETSGSGSETDFTPSGSGLSSAIETTIDLIDKQTQATNGSSVFTAPPQSSFNAGETTPKSTTTKETTTTPTPYDLSGWGWKWPEKFSIGNEVVQTDNSYKSHNVNLTITTYQENGITYHVADIYIRYIDNFISTFAKDTYGQSITEWPQDAAARHNAILTINGDYYGSRESGKLIRNYILYRDVIRDDVAALYYDGTMKGYGKSEFNTDEALANGCYQTFTFAPILVKDGAEVEHYETTYSMYLKDNPRSGIGYYEPGHYCFIVCDGRSDISTGVDTHEFAQLFVKHGCNLAVNLDGGDSSMLVYQNKFYNVPSGTYSGTAGGRKTSDFFMIVDK